jgi:hypothetical protein
MEQHKKLLSIRLQLIQNKFLKYICHVDSVSELSTGAANALLKWFPIEDMGIDGFVPADEKRVKELNFILKGLINV